MNNIRKAFRSLFKKDHNNILKILLLGVGLAMGLILLSKIFFEFTYDDFFPDRERIYLIVTNYVDEEGDSEEEGRVSGGIAPGMKREIPAIESATRWTHWGNTLLKTIDDNTYRGRVIFADSCFFDVLPLPMVAGNPGDVLGRPMFALISEKIAEKMGGVELVLGKMFEMEGRSGKMITIGGVFKDLPENSHLKYDVILSMSSIGNFIYDSSDRWMGYDRYNGYVKLYPGTQPEVIYPAFRKMQEKYQPLDRITDGGSDMWYTLLPLKELHSGTPEIKRMTLLLGLLAVALLFRTTMNYILIVLSSLVSRTKEMAIYKSYGADKKEIMKIMMTETILHLLVSFLVAGALIYLFHSKIEELLGVSVTNLFSLKIIVPVGSICVVVFLLSGVIPAVLYARIPVTTAFRNYKESRRKWKLASLFIQFAATCFLLVLLVVVWKQYSLMVNDNPGYNPNKVLYFYSGGIPVEQRQGLLSELNHLAFVKTTSTSTHLPIRGYSGNSVRENNKVLFSFVNLSSVDENYLSLMQIPLIEGVGFRENIPENRCIIDRKFAEKLVYFNGWKDGVAGKDITIEDDVVVHICGVYESIRIGSILYEDARPSMMFYRKTALDDLVLIRLDQVSPENIQAIETIIRAWLPGEERPVIVLKNEIESLYYSSRLFRDAVIIGGVVVFIISIIGLIGYLQDEINRRRAEVAIRRINGGTMADILRLFSKDILFIAIPALIAGSLCAQLAARKWQESFSVKTDLTVGLFLLCGILIGGIITGVVLWSAWYKAKDNPVNSLRRD